MELYTGHSHRDRGVQHKGKRRRKRCKKKELDDLHRLLPSNDELQVPRIMRSLRKTATPAVCIPPALALNGRYSSGDELGVRQTPLEASTIRKALYVFSERMHGCLWDQAGGRCHRSRKGGKGRRMWREGGRPGAGSRGGHGGGGQRHTRGGVQKCGRAVGYKGHKAGWGRGAQQTLPRAPPLF